MKEQEIKKNLRSTSKDQLTDSVYSFQARTNPKIRQTKTEIKSKVCANGWAKGPGNGTAYIPKDPDISANDIA